jgi:hypothetical protein
VNEVQSKAYDRFLLKLQDLQILLLRDGKIRYIKRLLLFNYFQYKQI